MRIQGWLGWGRFGTQHLQLGDRVKIARHWTNQHASWNRARNAIRQLHVPAEPLAI